MLAEAGTARGLAVTTPAVLAGRIALCGTLLVPILVPRTSVTAMWHRMAVALGFADLVLARANLVGRAALVAAVLAPLAAWLLLARCVVASAISITRVIGVAGCTNVAIGVARAVMALVTLASAIITPVIAMRKTARCPLWTVAVGAAQFTRPPIVTETPRFARLGTAFVLGTPPFALPGAFGPVPTGTVAAIDVGPAAIVVGP